MQKTKTKLITALLLTTIALAIIPLANASTGFINVLTAPPQIPAGGNISLDFTGVTFSGGQFYLLLSIDGFSQVSPTDLRFTPSFNVADLRAAGTIVVTDPTGTYPGSWTVGNDQIVGTIPANIAGGLYYIKAFDGAVTSLAVTTPAFTVTASLTVAPTTGAPGTSLTIKGNAFPANALVNLTYLNPVTAQYVVVQNLTQTGAIGNYTWVIAAPDIIGPVVNVPGGNNVPAASNAIQFQATENKTRAVYTATYTEMQRGVYQIGRPNTPTIPGNVQNATGIAGNLTDVSAEVVLGVNDNVRIAGNWFYPGNLTFRWDNTIDVTPTNRLANGTGFFNTTFVVPVTSLGRHNITIVDANNVVFVMFISVIQSITISPTSGPIGTTVTINGFGFPAGGVPANTAYNATITFDTTARGWALTDANGAFTTNITIPTAAGGSGHTITATTNDTALTSASKPFTITANFVLNATSFYANSSATTVTGTGTGFDPAQRFFVAIDNQFSPFTNTIAGIAPNAAGNLTFSFVGVGFQPGLHIVTVYQAGDGTGANAPVAKVAFTVLEDASSTLFAINKSVSDLHLDLNSINATLIAINGNTATLSTSIGTITAGISSMQSSVSGLSGSITSISSSVATVQTNLGTIQTSLSSLDAVLGVVAGDTATIKTSLGTITTSLASLDTKVTKIDGNVATVQTSLGTLTGTVTKVDGNVATIQTSLGTMQADIGTLKTDVTTTKDNTASLSPLVIVAIVLALVAAIAAIASIVLMRRKIAG